MAGATATRSAALDTLGAVRGGALADHAFDIATASLDARDRAFALELTYGTLRLRGRIDHILAGFSSRPLDRLDPDILDVLRLAAYQLLEMNGVPPYAAISQALELARGRSRAASGYVGGVLHALHRGRGTWTFPDFANDPVAHLTTWGSHPRWLVERWVARFGADAASRLIEMNNERPRLYLRLLGDVAAGLRGLAAAEVPYERIVTVPRAVAVEAADVVRALDAVPAIVQDPAAGLVASYVQAPFGARIVDVAAAPGGKALALAGDAVERAAFVVAADVSQSRMVRLRQNAERLSRPAPRGLDSLPIALVVADGLAPPFRLADVVVLDAPCTGTGTLRRHPDGRWRAKPADLVALAALQAQLLDAAAAIVAPGGLLLYATCSLEPEENEVQVQSFLTRQPEFAIDPGHDPEPAPNPGPDLIREDGALHVLPQRHGFDGAFAVKLRRSEHRAG